MMPFLIGVAGPSSAGKTLLAEKLAAALPAPAAVFPLDAYYKDLSGWSPEAVEAWNFDTPEALDEALLFEHLAALRQGRPVERPVYDYATHSRLGLVVRVEPKPFVVAEGLFALHWPQARRNMDFKIFVDAPDALCLARRQTRDAAERGQTPEETRKQFFETVQPMCERYVRPSRVWADIVVPGDQPFERFEVNILNLIRARRLGQGGLVRRGKATGGAENGGEQGEGQ